MVDLTDELKQAIDISPELPTVGCMLITGVNQFYMWFNTLSLDLQQHIIENSISGTYDTHKSVSYGRRIEAGRGWECVTPSDIVGFIRIWKERFSTAENIADQILSRLEPTSSPVKH